MKKAQQSVEYIDYIKLFELMMGDKYMQHMDTLQKDTKASVEAVRLFAKCGLFWLYGAQQLVREQKIDKGLLYKMIFHLNEVLELFGVQKENIQLEELKTLSPSVICTTLDGLVALINGDINALFDYANSLGDFKLPMVHKFMNILNKVKKFIGKGQNMLEDREAKGMTNVEMFRSFDKDESGFIDFWEFTDLCKGMGLNMSKDRFIHLFSLCDSSNNNQITYEEFENTLDILKTELQTETLSVMGLSTSALIKVFGFALFILILLFAFIFTGLATFKTGSSFSAIINSMFPVLSGSTLSKTKKTEDEEDNVKGVTEDVIQNMKQDN